MQLSWLGLRIVILARVVLAEREDGELEGKTHKRSRDDEKIWIWSHAKSPGLYKVNENLIVTPLAETLEYNSNDRGKVVPLANIGKLTLGPGHTVTIVEVLVVDYTRIRGRIQEKGGGWITMAKLVGRKKHIVDEYVTRLPGKKEWKSFLNAKGYKLYPRRKYGFLPMKKKLGTVMWTIKGLSHFCEDATDGDEVNIEMGSVKTTKTPGGVWSMHSMRSVVLQGCSILRGKRPAELSLRMTVNDLLFWAGSVSIKPWDLCSLGDDEPFPKGEVFIPVKNSVFPENTQTTQTPTLEMFPVALWILPYECFSIQRSGFHEEKGLWDSWEVHMKIKETIFHLLPAEPD